LGISQNLSDCIQRRGKIKKAGLEVPDTIKEKKEVADKAIVIEKSTEVRKVEVGDKIAFLRWGPIEIDIDEDKFLLIREIDIIAKI